MNENLIAEKAGKFLQFIATAFAAFTAGGRIVPLGDNGAVLKELAARLAVTG